MLPLITLSFFLMVCPTSCRALVLRGEAPSTRYTAPLLLYLTARQATPAARAAARRRRRGTRTMTGTCWEIAGPDDPGRQKWRTSYDGDTVTPVRVRVCCDEVKTDLLSHSPYQSILQGRGSQKRQHTLRHSGREECTPLHTTDNILT